MEVRQLQIFCVLAEELNFTRTAEKVHTVQSNVTSQIKALEDELGVPLFDRLGRRVILTEAGRRFLPFAMQALSVMQQGLQAAQAAGEPSGPLVICTPESILTYRLPPVLRTFRQRFPRVELVFRPHSTPGALADLEAGKIDLAFHMCDELCNAAMRSVALQKERVFLLSDPLHLLAKQRTVRLEDLASQNLLLTESGCGYRAKLDRELALHNIRPGHVTEFSSVEALKQCVAAGMGVGLLPAVVVAREVRQSVIKSLHWAGPSLDVVTLLVWHRDKWVSPAMTAFIEHVTESFREAELADPQWILSGSLHQ